MDEIRFLYLWFRFRSVSRLERLYRLERLSRLERLVRFGIRSFRVDRDDNEED